MTAAGRPATIIRFAVNGEPIELTASGGRRLLDVLRDDLGLTGTKEGCGEGECGACSVLVDDEVVVSCLVPACQVDGRDVRTVEGLAPSPGSLAPLQAAFLEGGAAQCGICTPGMLMAAQAFLASGAARTDDAIREAIAGNLCRCTGYTKIVEAIAAAPDGIRTAAQGGPPAAEGGGGAGTAQRVGSSAVSRPVAAAGSGPTVVRARSIDEALDLVSGGWRPLAGGTDLMVGLAAGSIPATTRFVDLTAVGELAGIRREGDELVIGALATYSELRRSTAIAKALPVLAEVAASIGAVQIQNRGTIGGNVMNASPAGDSLPVLLAADARLALRGRAGERTVAAADFFTGYRRTGCLDDELLAAVRIPIVADRRFRYRKVGTRRAQAISKVVLALSWRRSDARGSWSDVRVAFGSVAEVPLRARRAEAALDGWMPSAEVAERAAAAAEADVRPIDDVRSTAGYRRVVSGRILRRMVLDEVTGQDG
jgi:carbon-monoxide dehydrogenase small subunit/xanthine dehydrogenase small subunit